MVFCFSSYQDRNGRNRDLSTLVAQRGKRCLALVMLKKLKLNKQFTPITNLLQNLEIDEEHFTKLLLAGDLHAFEEELYQFVMTQIYDLLATTFIQDAVANEVFVAKMRLLAASQRMGKLQKRPVNLQLRSGTTIKLETHYARKVPKGLKGSRYLCFQYWGVIAEASPSYYAQVSKFSVLCGSFEIVKEVLGGLQIGGTVGRIRSLALAVAQKCLSQRVACMLGAGESLAGKRVVISTDGGRIRTREYQAEKNEAGTHHKFATPWKEPKLFVITIIDPDGKIERTERPVYDATFGEEGLFRLLGEYLKALNIKEVGEVQVIADGALWIWHKAKKMLLELGVAEDKIVETLDYYHAVEHLTKVIELLPKKSEKQRKSLFHELKGLLWEGKIKPMLEKIESQVQHLSKKLQTEIGYFEKNQCRLNYQKCREQNWLCGSGIIESGVRRRINLRFKSASCFWKQENLDGLLFLRCALLSERWKFVMQTVTNF